jgi:hypothetical protein
VGGKGLAGHSVVQGRNRRRSGNFSHGGGRGLTELNDTFDEYNELSLSYGKPSVLKRSSMANTQGNHGNGNNENLKGSVSYHHERGNSTFNGDSGFLRGVVDQVMSLLGVGSVSEVVESLKRVLKSQRSQRKFCECLMSSMKDLGVEQGRNGSVIKRGNDKASNKNEIVDSPGEGEKESLKQTWKWIKFVLEDYVAVKKIVKKQHQQQQQQQHQQNNSSELRKAIEDIEAALAVDGVEDVLPRLNQVLRDNRTYSRVVAKFKSAMNLEFIRDLYELDKYLQGPGRL